MPKVTPTPRLVDLIELEREGIVNKATIRTARLAEKYFPATPDERQAEVKSYEAAHYDNPDSPLYTDNSAAFIFAALKGIEKPVFRRTANQAITAELGAVVVPVNSRHYTHPASVKVNTPYIVVNTSHSRVRGLDGEKLALALTTTHVRPANENEIQQIVDSLLELRPALTIKTFGDGDGEE